MKITKIDVMQVKTPRIVKEKPNWRPIICRIYTDEGIYGDGEAALAYGKAALGAFGMVQELAKLIIGMDPLDNEVIWDILYRNTFWGQNGGPVFFAGISALDMALWDIKGKFFNVPVYKLLGGKKRDNLRTYASQLQLGWGEEMFRCATVDEFVHFSKMAVAEGYDCIKIDFFNHDRDRTPLNYTDHQHTLLTPYYCNLVEERVAAVREAVGPNVDIIMENHSYLDANSAVQLGRVVQKYNIFFYEEPNTPSPKTAKYISEKLGMPIAHGERIYSRWQFAPYFEDMSIQVIQPDLGTCGGITEGKKICDMAHTYDVAVQCHVCASPLSTAAALHLECVIPNFIIHEHHRFNTQMYNKELCIYDYQPVKGKYKVPELPGLGNEFSELTLTHCDKVTIQ